MTTLNTTRSKKMAQGFLAKNSPFKRKVQTYKKQFTAKPEIVFPQFCPTREADWIDGWTADLIYTASGYAEPDCIFFTPEGNILGSGLWILPRVEPNKMVEIYVIRDSFVIHYGVWAHGEKTSGNASHGFKDAETRRWGDAGRVYSYSFGEGYANGEGKAYRRGLKPRRSYKPCSSKMSVGVTETLGALFRTRAS